MQYHADKCAVIGCSVVSGLFVTPWTIARQATLFVGIPQARILECVAMPSSRGSSQPRDWTQVSCIAGGLYCLSHQGSPCRYICCLIYVEGKMWFKWNVLYLSQISGISRNMYKLSNIRNRMWYQYDRLL